jgi:hypothetical protein
LLCKSCIESIRYKLNSCLGNKYAGYRRINASKPSNLAYLPKKSQKIRKNRILRQTGWIIHVLFRINAMQAMTNFLHCSVTVLTVFAASLCAAQTSADYVGYYRRGSVDSAEQLALMDDNTYCYAVTAGSLDLLSGGRWTVLPSKEAGKDAGVALQEVKPNKPIFPAVAKNMPEQGGKVVFDFHGHSLSRARTAVFAVSADGNFPKEMRPLFHPDHNGWSSSYKLPAMDAAKVRYFYIGYAAEGERGSDVAKLLVYQYKLDKLNTVRVGFDGTHAAPLMQFSMRWKEGDQTPVAERSLYDGDERPFGSKRPLTEKIAESARTRCIEPALSSVSVYTQPRRDGATLLEPVKELSLDIKASQGKPWFELTKEN